MVVPVESFGLIAAILLLTPGFLSYKICKKIAVIRREHSSFDKSVYTVIGSGISFTIVISLIVFAVYLLEGHIWQPTLEQTELPVLAVIYIFSVAVAGGLGLVSGKIFYKLIHGDDDVRDPPVWELADENRIEPTQVTVITHSGDEIWGEINVIDLEPDGKDLLLQYPVRKTRDVDGNVINETELGDFTYVSEDSISQIHYETEIDI
ncbi:DUF6338 family protein [Natronorubrum sulfidifaciens]|uniref:DUF6338 family protein n=1 Tax=Natronorubrum sulfidifaciens TaxID=388259 RepID=UPI0013760B91|nr:DUF6338 family protein [Natronorubrum sulfidifaciens]